MKFENAVLPTGEQAAATFKSQSPGPVVMVNLLKFKPRATYDDGEAVSGAEAYGRYGAGFAPLLRAAGGRVIYSGAVRGLMIGQVDELWDAVAVVEYPSAEAFGAIIRSPEYQAISHHREAGLAGQLNIRTSAADNGFGA
jgi:uncharacterized protein (DUF1330 family)